MRTAAGPDRPGRVARLGWAAVAALLVTLAGRVGATAAPMGQATTSIKGTVVDGTAGSTLPGALRVALDGVGPGQAALSERLSPVDPAGQFSFDGVPADGTGYVVSVQYGGARYQAPVDLKSGAASPVALTVYEPTTSDAALRLSNAYWVLAAIDTQNQRATILETLTLENTGDRTFIGDHRGDPGSSAPGILPRTLRVPLPSGASGFAPAVGLNSAAMLPVANGFVNTDPITPGQHQIVYHYQMAYSNGGFEIRKSLPYVADHLIFLAPNTGLTFQSDRLGNGGTTQIGGKTYAVLGADSVPANQDVTVDVLGLPNPPTSRLGPDTLRLVAVGAVAPFLIVALALGLRASRKNRRDLASERRALLASIANLDDRFDRAQIDRPRYLAERQTRKQRLASLMLQEPSG